MMGAGIAYVSANAGIEVVLIDQKARGRRQGQILFRRHPRQGHQRKKVTSREEGRSAGPDHRDHRLSALEGCDLIVEAVFEDPGIKADVTKKPKR